MFKGEYQSGTFVEVFSAQGKDPLAHWKLTGSPAKRDFDKEVKSYVYHLEGNAMSTKMQLPGDSKYSCLALIQRYLVFQLNVPKGCDFSMDLGVTDMGQTKRRIVLSTMYKECQSNPLHCKIPIQLLHRSKWLNFCVDLDSLVRETWSGQMYKTLDSICISASCRLRRIFTMKGQPPDNTDDDILYKMPRDEGKGDYDNIPKACQFACDVSSYTQVINMRKIWYSLGMGEKAGTEAESDAAGGDGRKAGAGAGGQDPYHIAFGTKVSSSRKASSKESSGRKSEQSKPTTSRSEKDVSSRSWDRESSAGSRREGSSTSRGDASSRAGSGKDRTGSGKDRAGSGPKTRSRPKAEALPPRPSRPPPQPRDRRDSEPLQGEHADPELTVDKEKLRTSHTWTEGADGTEPIPYVRTALPPQAPPPVQPHPPAQPSSASRARRKPRVKSATSEKPKHAAASNKDELSLSSVATSTTSSQGSSRANSGTVREGAREYGLAAQEELHAGVTRAFHGVKGGHGHGESEHQVGGGGDDMTDIIHALNDHRLDPRRLPDGRGDHHHDDDEEEAGRRAEDTEEDEEPAKRLYQYSSKPKTAREQGQSNGARARRSNVNTHRTRVRRKTSEDKSMGKQSQHPSHHHRNHTTAAAAAVVSSEDEDARHQHIPASKLSPRKSGSRAKDRSSGSREARDSGIGNGFSHFPEPHLHAITPSPVNSQSRKSISKKSLREIPKEELRLSGGSKPYVPTNYQMLPDVGDSFEAQLLQSMKREVAEECGNGTSDDDHQGGGHNLSQYRYGSDDLSDSSDEMSTLKPTMKAGQQPHNYQDEMGGLGNEFLTQSNPRVFSPPIVLPSTTHPSSVSVLNNANHEPTDMKFSQYKKAPPIQPAYPEFKEHTDEEDELDLLYDQVLNCYYDPKTNKYYELV